jgi:cation diffusion facilitator family transporter
MAGGSTSHIIQSLVSNLAIAIGKLIAAVISGSGALLAETLHSFADCGNQLLLLMGVKRAGRPADAKHPMGYGPEVYFWSFMVALLLFTGGGVFSIYEGIHKMRHPEAVGSIWLGMAILGGSFLIEGWATLANISEMKKRRGQTPFFRYLRETKDSDLVVIFGENSAAVIGLALAMCALLMSWVTQDGRWDAGGSLAIGVVLVGVAVFLAIEVKSLLVGESADPSIETAVHELAKQDPTITEVLHVVTMQQGPGEVMVAMKVRMADGMVTADLVKAINAFEVRLEQRCPEVKWSFIEPDNVA